jgi:hypothetical protein
MASWDVGKMKMFKKTKTKTFKKFKITFQNCNQLSDHYKANHPLKWRYDIWKNGIRQNDTQ